MARNPLDLPVDDFEFLYPYWQDMDDPAANHTFRFNYLKMLEFKIDIQQMRVDKFEFMFDKIAGLREDIAGIRSDPEGDGITRAEWRELRDLKHDLHGTLNRLDQRQDFDTVLDRLTQLEADFAQKSDEWGIVL